VLIYSKEILHHYMECGNVHSSQLEISCKAWYIMASAWWPSRSSPWSGSTLLGNFAFFTSLRKF